MINDQNKMEAYDRNAHFSLKALMTVSAGGLITVVNFLFKFLELKSNTADESTLTSISQITNLLSRSYFSFLLALISVLISAISTYFANRLLLENRHNLHLVRIAIITGTFSFVAIVCGLVLTGITIQHF